MSKTILSLSLVIFLQACVALPETGQRKLILTSTAQENQMGEQGYAEVKKEAKIVQTQPFYNALQNVGQRIAAQANRPDFNWEYSLIEDEQLNAWCMPGGKIAVYTGILPFMKNEAGMAAVIGHEVAHATLRHSGQRITKTMGLQTVLSILSGGLQNSPNKDAVMTVFNVGGQFGMLKYGRNHETESDLVGLKYMAKAGYDPREAVEFWKRFAEVTAGSAPPEFMTTHPGSGTRVNDLNNNMAEALKLYEAAPQKFGKGISFYAGQ